MGRRRFLQLSAMAGLATACGGQAEVPLQVVGLFSSDWVIAAGRPQRVPFGLVADSSLELADDVPLQVTIRFGEETVERLGVVGRVVSHDHDPGVGEEPHEHANLLRYYALRTTFPEAGIYDLEIEVEGRTASLPVQAFDPSEISLPLTGEPFPVLATPTLDDAMGVDPVCTLFDGPCPYHTRSAADVLANGEPMALLVATPAFCQTSYCGPVLTTLIEAATDFDSIVMVHVEPWANPTEGSGLSDPGLRTAPTIDALALTFEPALFLVDRNGIIVERIDNVFDASELRAALATIS